MGTDDSTFVEGNKRYRGKNEGDNTPCEDCPSGCYSDVHLFFMSDASDEVE